ncbi:hypothetical protein [Plasmodium yoelii yoelii]|uniref:Uncharacterized protein n=1 Tax=Plasmodium yoelii yoelii TaxID=73239 RepID=Q7RIZ2_PLAYO|nr:hypothetical protein [Plasmodium yoelii yoelii]
MMKCDDDDEEEGMVFIWISLYKYADR